MKHRPGVDLDRRSEITCDRGTKPPEHEPEALNFNPGLMRTDAPRITKLNRNTFGQPWPLCTTTVLASVELQFIHRVHG